MVSMCYLLRVSHNFDRSSKATDNTEQIFSFNPIQLHFDFIARRVLTKMTLGQVSRNTQMTGSCFVRSHLEVETFYEVPQFTEHHEGTKTILCLVFLDCFSSPFVPRLLKARNPSNWRWGTVITTHIRGCVESEPRHAWKDSP